MTAVEPRQRWTLRLGDWSRSYTILDVIEDGRVVFEDWLTPSVRDWSRADHMLASEQWELAESSEERP